MNFFREIDLEQWLSEQLLHIENPEERKLFREWMEQTMVPMRKEYLGQLENIEKELFQRNTGNVGKPIVTAIEERQKVDVTDTFLFPMDSGDMEETIVDTKEVFRCLNEEQGYRLYSVYFDGDYRKLCQMMERNAYFQARAYTAYGQYKGKVCLKRSTRYDGILQGLYQDFVQNSKEWIPIHTCYLQKILEVELIQLDLPMEGEIVERIEVDFGEYAGSIKYHMVPLWNVTSSKITTTVYPVRTPEGNFYEHRILGDKLLADSQYLISGDCNIWSIQRLNEREQDIIIRCDARRPIQWTLREIVGMRQDRIPVMEYRISAKNPLKKAIRTRAEAIHYANSLQIKELNLIEIYMEEPKGFREEQTYDMDAFLKDRIELSPTSPVLYLRWKAVDIMNPWNLDMLSYAQTCFQRAYPQYCIKSEIV